MSNKFDNCPYCNQTVMKGAMICVACGRRLQTLEERIVIIEKLKSKPKSNMKRFLKPIVIIIILGVLYYYYSERLIEIINNIIKQ